MKMWCNFRKNTSGFSPFEGNKKCCSLSRHKTKILQNISVRNTVRKTYKCRDNKGQPIEYFTVMTTTHSQDNITVKPTKHS